MSAESNKKLVKEYLEAFSAGKFDDVESMMSDDATWWVAGNFPLSGTKSRAEFCEGLRTQLPQLVPGGIRFELGACIAEGDRVAIEVESHGTTATGKTYNNLYHFAIEVRDGKIHRVREYLDTSHADEVLCQP